MQIKIRSYSHYLSNQHLRWWMDFRRSKYWRLDWGILPKKHQISQHYQLSPRKALLQWRWVYELLLTNSCIQYSDQRMYSLSTWSGTWFQHQTMRMETSLYQFLFSLKLGPRRSPHAFPFKTTASLPSIKALLQRQKMLGLHDAKILEHKEKRMRRMSSWDDIWRKRQKVWKTRKLRLDSSAGNTMGYQWLQFDQNRRGKSKNFEHK